MPKVSICIPTHNTARYLPEAIESVFAQTYSDYELVVCDNASTDDTPALCRSYAADPRFRYVRFDRLVNQGGNWNRCVGLARGEYVALLHADDRYLPHFLKDRVGALEANLGAGIAFGAVNLIDSDGRLLGSQVYRAQPIAVSAPDFFPELLMGCKINPASLLVRRTAYNLVPPFSESRVWAIDWEMWLRLAMNVGVVYSPDPASEYRIHGSSGTVTALLTGDNSAEEWEVLSSVLAELDRRPELLRFAPLKLKALRSLALRTIYTAGYNAERGHGRGVRAHLSWVRRMDPSLVWTPTFLALWLSGRLGPWIYRTFRRLRPIEPGG